MSSQNAALRLRQVGKEYAAAEGGPSVRVLSGIDLEVRPGESLAIVGPSGSGKSTLLQIIGTLDRPTAGHVEIDGQEIGRLDDVATARLRNRKIGFVFQAHHLLPQCTVLENVLVPTLADDPAAAQPRAADRARQLLERVGLGARLGHRPARLSGGEQQRVAVVRALINQPSLLLADEPTGALDRQTAETLAQLLLDLNREEHTTLILVTHALDLARRMQRVLELRDGRLTELPTSLVQTPKQA